MRQILKRFGIYLLVLAALLTLFNSWPPLLPSGTSGARLGHYVRLWFRFGVAMLFWTLCLELMYRVFRWKANWVERRRSKESEQTKLKLSD
jgi:hypothetical protein